MKNSDLKVVLLFVIAVTLILSLREEEPVHTTVYITDVPVEVQERIQYLEETTDKLYDCIEFLGDKGFEGMSDLEINEHSMRQCAFLYYGWE